MSERLLQPRSGRGAELLCNLADASRAVGSVFIGGERPRRLWIARASWARLTCAYGAPDLALGESELARCTFAGLPVYVSELPELESEFDWRADLVLTLRAEP